MNYLDAGKAIIEELNKNGFLAYFVGGMVRDYLINGDVSDIDIATNALPSDVMRIFPKTHPIGIKFGMILVIYGEYKFEVTTFRSDGETMDNRHPDTIKFESSLEIDVKRRDFTVNGMAFDKNFNLFDYVDGKKDLLNKLIRAIGDPNKRFNEDGLRILRGLYFVSKLGFDIEEETYKAMCQNKQLLEKISIERIYNELKKASMGLYFGKCIKLLDESGISKYLPDLEKGIHYLAENNLSCDLDTLFVLSFKLNEEMSEGWKFSTSDYNKYNMALNLALALEDGCYNRLHVYSNKEEVCLLANKVNVLLGFVDCSQKIKDINKNLTIHKTCDLVFKGQDVMKITKKEPAEWLGNLIDDIKYLVIMGELPNSYDEIKAYAINRLLEEGVEIEK